MKGKPIHFENSVGYDRWMGVWTTLIGEQFLHWLEPEQAKRWADIGCGTGAFTEQIIEGYAPVLMEALDPSQHQIDFAVSRYPETTANYRIGDAQDLPLPDGQFDYVTMALVLFFVPGPEKAASEMLRVCRSGGKIGAYLWDVFGEGLPTAPTIQALEARNVACSLPPSSEVSRIGEMQRVFEKAGAKSIETAVFEAERIFASFDEYWSLSAESVSIKSCLQDLAATEIDDIKQDVRSRLSIDSSGRVCANACANAVIAEA